MLDVMKQFEKLEGELKQLRNLTVDNVPCNYDKSVDNTVPEFQKQISKLQHEYVEKMKKKYFASDAIYEPYRGLRGGASTDIEEDENDFQDILD